MPLRSLLPAVLAILFLLLPARSGSAVADLNPTPAGTAAPDSLVELQVLLVLYPKTFCKELSPAEMERLMEEVAEFRHFYERAVGDRSESMGWGPGLDRYDEVIARYDGDGEATISELMWKGRWGYDSGGIHWDLHELGQLLCTGQALDGGAGRGR